MKIIHCADLHLDSKLETNLDRKKAKKRKAELIESFERLVNYAKDNGVQAVIVAGDVFDRNNVTDAAVSAVASIIAEASQIDFLVLSGNHDNNNPFERLTELPSNLLLFSDSWKSYNYDDVTISGIAVTAVNANIVYSSLNLSALQYNIVVMHGDISSEINLPQLKGKNIDYLALGHLHEHSEGKLDERGVYAYSGCLESRGFDESGIKGFYLIDTEKRTRRFVSGLSVRNMFELNVDITGLSQYAEIRSAIDSELIKSGVRECDMVKIVLTGSYNVETNKQLSQLLNHLESKVFFAKIKDKSRMEIRAEDYENDISLKGEFVRKVMSSELSPQEKDKIILCGIRAIRGEEPQE